jgi:hypothetical protein
MTHMWFKSAEKDSEKKSVFNKPQKLILKALLKLQ